MVWSAGPCAGAEDRTFCDIPPHSGNGRCFEGDCVTWGTCTASNLVLCSRVKDDDTCLEKTCAAHTDCSQ